MVEMFGTKTLCSLFRREKKTISFARKSRMGR
jgi:hypothetical protein